MKNSFNQETGYQRVINALHGTKQLRAPWGLVMSLYGSKLISCPLSEYYSNPNLYFEGQQAVVETFNPDLITTPFVMSFEGEAFGSQLNHFDNSPPQIRKPAINSYQDIKNLTVPDIDFGSKVYILETTRLLASKYKNDRFIAGITLSCIDSPAMIMGIEAWIDTLLFHRKEAEMLMEKTSRYFIDFANALFDHGIDVLVIPNVFSNPTIITTKIIEELTLNVLNNVLKELKGPAIIHHGGALIVDFLPYFESLSNVVGFTIDNRENLEKARRLTGNKLLLGNLNIADVAYKTSDLVKRKTSEILENRKSDYNFIFFNSGADILYETPRENIMTISNTVNNSN